MKLKHSKLVGCSEKCKRIIIRAKYSRKREEKFTTATGHFVIIIGGYC